MPKNDNELYEYRLYYRGNYGDILLSLVSAFDKCEEEEAILSAYTAVIYVYFQATVQVQTLTEYCTISLTLSKPTPQLWFDLNNKMETVVKIDCTLFDMYYLFVFHRGILAPSLNRKLRQEVRKTVRLSFSFS